MAEQKESGIDWRAFTPEDSPKTPMDLRADPARQALSTAEVRQGGPAHDFSSPIYDFSNGHKVITGRGFNLLDTAKEAPVALIFGSYT